MTISELKAKRGIVIDSNLFLLYCVGYCDAYKIRQFTQKLGGYNAADYGLLRQFIGVIHQQLHRELVTTPNILTEVVNLIGVKSDQFRPVLNKISGAVSLFREVHLASFPLLKQPYFSKLGLTDTGLITLAQEDYTILTSDENLRSFLVGTGGSAMNFDELRVLLPASKTTRRHKP